MSTTLQRRFTCEDSSEKYKTKWRSKCHNDAMNDKNTPGLRKEFITVQMMKNLLETPKMPG